MYYYAILQGFIYKSEFNVAAALCNYTNPPIPFPFSPNLYTKE